MKGDKDSKEKKYMSKPGDDTLEDVLIRIVVNGLVLAAMVYALMSYKGIA